MLDQNTDRMLHIIMVVVIGALLFTMVNGSIPSIFTMITDGYVEQVDESPDSE